VGFAKGCVGVFSGNREEVGGSGGLSGGTVCVFVIRVRVDNGGSCGSRSMNQVVLISLVVFDLSPPNDLNSMGLIPPRPTNVSIKRLFNIEYCIGEKGRCAKAASSPVLPDQFRYKGRWLAYKYSTVHERISFLETLALLGKNRQHFWETGCNNAVVGQRMAICENPRMRF
jgi:hypothetical protein